MAHIEQGSGHSDHTDSSGEHAHAVHTPHPHHSESDMSKEAILERRALRIMAPRVGDTLKFHPNLPRILF